jgi:ATP-dependent helicase/DNAse subunit B
MQEGAFPAPARAEPFLGDAERRALNSASGLRLELREDDRLGAERSLFYAAASRPTELLAVSWHAADEDGEPAVRSPFVDDLLDLLDVPDGAVQTRELGAAGFADPALAPTARERERAAAAAAPSRAPRPIGPLRDPDVLADLQARATWSASALESWVACPVRWFAERLLGAEALVPDPEPLVRGQLAHAVLEDAIRALVSDGGRLTPEHLPEARRLALASLERLRGDHRLSANPQRAAAALRRVEAEVLRYLDFAATSGTRYTPRDFELTFGGREDDLPPVDLGDGLVLRGRIDRVDGAPDGTALIYDYKGAVATPWTKWPAEGKLQLALYLLALPQLVGLEPAGGLYQALGGDDPRPRGLIADGADPGAQVVRGDLVTPEEMADALDGARRAACAAVADVRAGRLEPRPGSCGWKGGGCSFPSICRSAR